MLTSPTYYFEQLYPLQDLSLRLIADLDTGFYLTGGTAVSRAYLNHRFPDDLDLFVNFDKRFTLGIYSLDLARRLCSATHKDWEQVRWIDAPDPTIYLAELNQLGEQLILV